MNAGPSRGGAGRPEKRDQARSKLPQKKWTGLLLPTNAQRDALSTCSQDTRMRQNRFAYAGSYEAWTVSSSNRTGSGISTGIGQMRTGRFISVSVRITSA